jgi:eukaryotic-like serine/threonine-protein kinase
LPDGRRFLYLRAPGKSGIFAASLDAKPDQQSLQQVAPAQFGVTYAQASNAAGGVLFFVRDGTVIAQPFDAKSLSLAGDSVPVVQQIGTGGTIAHFSVTSSGVMAYRTGAGTAAQLAWFDRDGNNEQRIGEPGTIVSLSLSPDESQVALLRSSVNTNGTGDIWLLDLKRNLEARLTTGDSVQVFTGSGPTWSPDGKQLAYGFGTKLHI